MTARTDSLARRLAGGAIPRRRAFLPGGRYGIKSPMPHPAIRALPLAAGRDGPVFFPLGRATPGPCLAASWPRR